MWRERCAARGDGDTYDGEERKGLGAFRVQRLLMDGTRDGVKTRGAVKCMGRLIPGRITQKMYIICAFVLLMCTVGFFSRVAERLYRAKLPVTALPPRVETACCR